MSRILLSTLFLLNLSGCGASKVPDDVVPGGTDSTESDPDADEDGYPASTDCDDADAAVNPGAEELCDGIDNNCDAQIDEDLLQSAYTDSDGDGFGDPETAAEVCELSEDQVDNGDDCDDTNVDISPMAAETCDGVDNNCDELIDEGTLLVSYADVDGDGYGDEETRTETCEVPEGNIETADDCDDTSALINPDADEVCDGADNNCDGVTDDDAIDRTTFYSDGDGDGYGVDADSVLTCEAPDGYSASAGDCNDDAADISPGLAEACDGLDTDCDGDTDEDFVCECYDDDALSELGEVMYGVIEDETDDHTTECGEGEGAMDASVLWTAPRTGTFTFSTYGSDFDTILAIQSPECDEEFACNDDSTWFFDTSRLNVSLEEGESVVVVVSASSTSETGIYRVTASNADLDGDGYDETEDCNDSDDEIYPGAEEVCDDIDNDCNGAIDDGLSTSTYYVDEDGDGYGTESSAFESCLPWFFEDRGVLYSGDCLDSNDAVHPGVTGWYSSAYTYTIPFIAPTGAPSFLFMSSHDYDCSGEEEARFGTDTVSSSFSCSAEFGSPYSSSDVEAVDAWSGSAPDCGESGTFVVECQGVVYTIDIGWGESTVRLWDLETETRTQTCH